MGKLWQAIPDFAMLHPELLFVDVLSGRSHSTTVMSQSILSIFASLDKGWATLIAAALAAVVSMISLFFSVLSSRAQARLSARLTETTNISKESREYTLKQLTCFYDPIYALLATNKAIFERIGPTSPARRERKFNDEEIAEVWQTLSNEVIVPNNQRVCEIIQGQLHYLAEGDDESLYLEFLTHAHTYRVFKKKAYEAYTLFPFPKDFFLRLRRHDPSCKAA